MAGGGLSNREQQLLRTAFLLKAAFDGERTKKEKEPSKPRWLQVLESAAVASFITVIFGGIAGTLLVQEFQRGEQRQAVEAAEAKERFENRGDAVERAYGLLADGGYHARSLVNLTEPPLQGPGVEAERSAIAKDISDFNRRWQKEKYTVGFLLLYYHGDDAGVASAWRKCVTALDDLRASAQKIHNDYYSAKSQSRMIASIPGETPFLTSIKELAVALEAARKEEKKVR